MNIAFVGHESRGRFFRLILASWAYVRDVFPGGRSSHEVTRSLLRAEMDAIDKSKDCTGPLCLDDLKIRVSSHTPRT
jgi:hypothetical protein